MSPKRERRKRVRQEAVRRAAGGIQWLGILLVLCGAGMSASGLYFIGTIVGLTPPEFFPRFERFWEPTATTVRIGAIGDLLAGTVTIVMGARGIRKRMAKRQLYVVMACALLGLISDMLGGLYAISAQATWYLTLFTVLFRR